MKMKKILMVLLVGLFLVSFVSAKQGDNDRWVQNKVRVMEQLIENGVSESAIQAMNGTINRFQERNQNRFMNMKELKVQKMTKENLECRIRQKGKFFGFIPVSFEEVIVIDPDGDIIYEEDPKWVDIFVKEEVIANV